MGTHHVSLPAQMTRYLVGILLVIWCVGIQWVFAADKAQGVLPDVLIQAEENRPIEQEKPPFNPDVKEDAPFEADLEIEDGVKSKLPSAIGKATVFVPETYTSQRVVVPSTNWIALPSLGEPVRVFYPLKELLGVYPAADSKTERSKGQWELAVVDDSGKAFKKFNGTGLPPETIEFDGRGEEGAWLRVGQVYTGVLTFHDSKDHAHTAMGKPFALAGLSVQSTESSVISLSHRMLFDSKSPSAQLSVQGKELLKEAAQTIQRYYPGLKLRITAYLSRSDGAWVQAAAEVCAKNLGERLLLASGMVESLGRPATPDLEQRVDVAILNH